MAFFRNIQAALLCSLIALSPCASASDDKRELVELPARMQEHMLANMRDHLAAVHEMLTAINEDNLDQAAQIAEQRLGMSSLGSHGAHHMGRFMPKQMGELGMSMHRAASRFALVAEEGERLASYQAINDITAACVACHAAYKIR